MFETKFEIMELPYEEADILVGEPIIIKNNSDRFCYVIELDEYFEYGFGRRYSVCSIGENNHILYQKAINVWIPGWDHINFCADIKPTKDLYFQLLHDKTLEFLERSNYRKINVHALEDYLHILSKDTQIIFDWN